MVDEPGEQAEGDADNYAGDNRKVERGVFGFERNVARKAAKVEWEFAAEKEKGADKDKCRAQDEQNPAEFAKVHTLILKGLPWKRNSLLARERKPHAARGRTPS
jgi:hypothetical protein